MKVSYHNYRRMHEFLRPDIRRELEEVLSLDNDSQLFEYQYRNENSIGRFLGGRYGIGTQSGTAALQFALTALGIGPGDEVITSAHTYIATLLAISATGAKPVLVDVCKDTMLMDTNLIEPAINEHTKAILPVHLYGQMCDMPKISRVAGQHGLRVVEDACQSHLAKFRGEYPGARSDAACYSFYPSKILGGMGNGGMVTFHTRSLWKRFESLRNPMADTALVLKSCRTPAYLDWLNVAFIKAKMRHMHAWIRHRQAIADRYLEEIRDGHFLHPTKSLQSFHVYREYALRTSNRDRIRLKLDKKGIETAVHYPVPVYEMKPYRKDLQSTFSETGTISRTVLSLPTSPFLSEDEVSHIIASIQKI